MDTKISVILPVYNDEECVEQALKCLLGQTLKEINIICIDSGSKDKTSKILEKYEKKNSKIKLVNKINEGFGSALNAGLNLADGEYVSIINPGDYIDKKMFENLYNLILKSGADVAKCAALNTSKKRQTPPKNAKIPIWFFRINECPELLYYALNIFSSIYKRSFLNNNSIRFVETKGYGYVDIPFYIETMLLASKIVYTSKPFYTIKKEKENNDFVSIFDRFDEINQILLRLKVKDKNIISNIYKKYLKTTKNVISNLNKDKILPMDEFNIKNIPYEIQLKIERMVQNMDEDIIKNSPNITAFERNFFSLLSPAYEAF